MSELENLAAEIRALAQDGNRAQQLAAAMASEIDQLGTSVASLGHLRHLGGLSEALDALSSARRKASEAAAQLQSLQSGAEGFADRLVGGSDATRAGLVSALGAMAVAAASRIAGSLGLGQRRTPAVSSRTLDDLERVIADFNPNAPDAWDPTDPYLNNCGMVAANVFDYLSGKHIHPAPTGTLSIAEMNARTGRKQVQLTPQEIEDVLRAAGPGAHAVVGIDRRGEDAYGHWFNVFYDGHEIYTVDAQPGGGIIDGFPPPRETNVAVWDISL